MKLRNLAGDKSLLGLFQNGSIKPLHSSPLDPSSPAPPIVNVQEAIPFEIFVRSLSVSSVLLTSDSAVASAVVCFAIWAI